MDKDGTVNNEFNLNGALLNIAGICNINRNIFGKIPHQERTANTNLSNKDRKFLFDSLLKNLKLTKDTCFYFLD